MEKELNQLIEKYVEKGNEIPYEFGIEYYQHITNLFWELITELKEKVE